MPYYYLVQRHHLSTEKTPGRGLPAAKMRIGFLDFLRDLKDDVFAFTPYEDLRVEGLEEVLLAAKPNIPQIAYEIRCILQGSASDLQSKLCADVQIVFRNDLVLGDTLWVEHPAERRLPVHLIFGSPTPEELAGHPYYRVSFNLSSP
jgi:hypothetical protein